MTRLPRIHTSHEAAPTYDVIVVGLGALGSASAWRLADAGVRALAIEQFALGHDRGASHDTSRIIRHSYHRRDYVRLTHDAYADWSALEQAAGERFVTFTGGLDLRPADSITPLSAYTDSLAAERIRSEVLSADEIRARWPQIRVADDTSALFQPRTGIVPAGRSTAAMQRLAVAAGATLVDRTPVTEITQLGDAVVVSTPDRDLSAGRVVLCADAWTPNLLRPLGWSPRLTVLDQQVTYFAPPDAEMFGPDRFPVWVWLDEPSYYGFPTYGEATVKAGQDCGGPIVDPDRRVPGTDTAARERLTRFMAAAFPASGTPRRSLRCLYTLTPDRDFVLGPVPGADPVLVCLGAAHAFKFAPTLGRLVADMALDRHEPAAEWVHNFRPSRPALTDPTFSPTWNI